MSTERARPFYKTGGNLEADAPSYVERKADDALYIALCASRFCYVLTPRQMGKSSLMVHTATRLQRAGIDVVKLDLTRLGTNLSLEQWYHGLLADIARPLNLGDSLEDFFTTSDLGPHHRWLHALLDVVMLRRSRPLVIFIDELDLVLKLPFKAQEFFAGLRSLYNLRTDEPTLEGLTFCLLGVISPSELVPDPQLTPFNIGVRISLHDFTPQEARSLAIGLGRDEKTNRRLLDRILYWTGGHPYLTQVLCKAVLETPEARRPTDVDRLCEALYLSPRGRNQDSNLSYVRDRLLDVRDGGPKLEESLSAYAKIHRGQRVEDSDASALAAHLRLSGVVGSEGGRLVVRNRIYRRVFDRRWIDDCMPEQEIRRQKAAYWRGLVRAGGTAAGVFVVFFALLLYALDQRSLADKAQTRAEEADRYRGMMSLNAAVQVHPTDPTLAAAFLLEARNMKSHPRWRNLALEVLGEKPAQAVFGRPNRRILSARLVNGSRQVALLYVDNRVTLEQLGNRGPVAPGPPTALGEALALEVTPDGRRLALGRTDGWLEVMDPSSPTSTAQLQDNDAVLSLRLSPRGDHLMAVRPDGTLGLWNLQRMVRVGEFEGFEGPSLAFSPDGSSWVAARPDGTLCLAGTTPGAAPEPLFRCGARASVTAFSPDGTRVATACEDGTIRMIPLEQRREAITFQGHWSRINALLFSPDGSQLLSAGDDRMVLLHRLGSTEAALDLRGFTGAVNVASFSQDGQSVIAGGLDETLRIWSARDGTLRQVLQIAPTAIIGIEAGANDLLLVRLRDGTARLWKLDLNGEPEAPEGMAAESMAPGEPAETGMEDALLRRLEAVSPVCVPPTYRIEHLSEDRLEANKRFRECETKAGRAP